MPDKDPVPSLDSSYNAFPWEQYFSVRSSIIQAIPYLMGHSFYLDNSLNPTTPTFINS